MNLQDRITNTGIGATIRKVDSNPAMRPAADAPSSEVQWYRDATHWRVYLRNISNGEKMQLTYTMGPGHKGREPRVAEIMDSCLADASFALSNASYIEFARELGIEPDSRARRVFDSLVAQTEKLRRFLGEDFDVWMNDTDFD